MTCRRIFIAFALAWIGRTDSILWCWDPLTVSCYPYQIFIIIKFEIKHSPYLERQTTLSQISPSCFLLMSVNYLIIFQGKSGRFQTNIRIQMTNDPITMLQRLVQYRYEFNLNRIIQMYNPDDTRRKNNSTNNIKTVFGSNSHNSLLSAIDKKRTDTSKEKVKITQMPQQSEHFDLKNSATINFRTIKNNQINQQNQKAVKDCYQLKIQKKPSTVQQPSGIQINVNLQNMLPTHKKFQLNEAHSQRSLSRKRKDEEKNSKINQKATKNNNNMTLIQDFQCDEILQLKPERKTQKKMQPLTEKSILPAALSGQKGNPLLKQKSGQINDIQKQLKNFELKAAQINLLGESQALSFLDCRQICYQIDSLYIQKKQKHLTWIMRAILMDWMMHISYEFLLKRETLYVALALVDNFFQSTMNLSKADFQLTGAAALFIAAKLEELQPLSSKQFAKSTKQRYSAEEIKTMETRIVKALKYNLNAPTISMWANKVMQQWDLFLDNTNILQDDFFLTHEPKYFKKIDEQSYKNYRHMMQYLDCSILDIQTVQYKPKTLVCSLLYLILGKQFQEFNKKKIVSEITRTSLFFLEENDYNRVFGSFLENCIGIKMFELLPSVQYMASYFVLPLTYERPCFKTQEQSFQTMHLQEYCSYQTYNPSMLSVVRKRFRGIYQ